MIAELAAIRDAMNTATGAGRDLSAATQLAKAYISAHVDQWSDASLDECVRQIDWYHMMGDEDGAWRVQAYLLATFEPQHITGEWNAMGPLAGMAGT